MGLPSKRLAISVMASLSPSIAFLTTTWGNGAQCLAGLDLERRVGIALQRLLERVVPHLALGGIAVTGRCGHVDSTVSASFGRRDGQFSGMATNAFLKHCPGAPTIGIGWGRKVVRHLDISRKARQIVVDSGVADSGYQAVDITALGGGIRFESPSRAVLHHRFCHLLPLSSGRRHSYDCRHEQSIHGLG